MQFGNGTIIAFFAGCLWGLLWMLILAIAFMLVSGAKTIPPLGASTIAAGLAFAVMAACPIDKRAPAVHIIAIATLIIVLALGTNGRPLGVSLRTAPMWQTCTLVFFVGLTWRTLCLCLNGINGRGLSRYQIEVFLLRNLKGFGLLVFTILVALPFYVMVMTSLKSQQALLANPLDLSLDFGQGVHALVRSYRELFEVFHFGTFLINSTVVSVFTVIVTLVLAIPGAYAVARMTFPGQAFLSRSILLIYMIPAIILVIPLYAVFSQLGLRNSLLGLIIVYPATTLPVAVYMLQGYFRGLPTDLEDAGLMDGLTRLGVIIKITLPLSLPALASVALYVFMIAWNEFLFAFMFLDNIDMFTLSRGVVSLNSSEVPRQHLMAGAVIATVPVMVLFLWFERFLVSGLTSGSVKG